jgi:hypothetical protein
MSIETGVKATVREFVEAWFLAQLAMRRRGKEADPFWDEAMRKNDEIAKAHGLPDLPSGQHYLVRNDLEIIF